MAVFFMVRFIDDLRRRINMLIIAERIDGIFMFCSELGITGSIVAVLQDAINLNNVKSLDNNTDIVKREQLTNNANESNYQ